MMKYASPYTPGAGTMPPYLAGRDNLLKKADKDLAAMIKGYPQKSVIYYGLRGVGKTVILNAIEAKADNLNILYDHIEIAEKRSFLRQISNTSKKMIHRMSVKESAKDLMGKALGILQAFSITYNPQDQTFSAGLTEPSAYITTGNLSDDLTEMFVTLGRMALKADMFLCFFIDEIQYMKDDEMEAFVNALHRVSQLRLPITVYGAGLPKVLKILGDVKSYAERLFDYVEIGQLPPEAAADAIVKPAEGWGISYSNAAVDKIIQITKGYPYFIQELCHTVWEYTDADQIELEDVNRVTPTFLEHLDKSFFIMRYERCTKKEHDFLFAMLRCGDLPCTISNVALQLKKRVNSISPTRAQLINKGIIYSTGHGEIDFTVPLFDEYLRRINPELRYDGE